MIFEVSHSAIAQIFLCTFSILCRSLAQDEAIFANDLLTPTHIFSDSCIDICGQVLQRSINNHLTKEET